MDIGLLICLIESHKIIYDGTHRNKKSRIIVDNVWQEIAGTLNESVDACQRQWKILREQHGRDLKAVKVGKPSGSDGEPIKCGEWSNSLQFLNQHIKPRKTHSNVAAVQPASARTSSCSSAGSPWDTYSSLLSPHSPHSEDSRASDGNDSSSATQPIKESVKGAVQTIADLKKRPATTVLPERGQTMAEPEVSTPQPKPALHSSMTSNIMWTNDTYVSILERIIRTGPRDGNAPDPLDEAARHIAEHFATRKERTSSESFARYVAVRLDEMPEDERKEKRQKILLILEE